MTIVVCAMESCKFNKKNKDDIPFCKRKGLVLNPFPKYLPLAKQFSGTIRCMDYLQTEAKFEME